MDLTIAAEKVKEAAKVSDEAKRVLETLFPDVFKVKFQALDRVKIEDGYGPFSIVVREISRYAFQAVNGSNNSSERKGTQVAVFDPATGTVYGYEPSGLRKV